MTNSEFLQFIGNLAREDMVQTGVLASLTIAQAILESGWGKSDLAATGNNLFGIKATSSWVGKVYNAQTKECYDGTNMVNITASFKAYDGWEESIADHSALFVNAERYKKVVGETDYKIACQEVKNGGYATDPDYTGKLISLIEQYKLYEYDVVIIKEEEEAAAEEEQEHWAVLYETRLLDRGIITTRKNLDEPPTRGEMSVIICNLLDLMEGKPDEN